MACSLDTDHGKWHTPSQAAHHIPGAQHRKSVIELCIRGEIEHVAKETGKIDPNTDKPVVRYYISDQAIRAYIRRNTVKPNKAA